MCTSERCVPAYPVKLQGRKYEKQLLRIGQRCIKSGKTHYGYHGDCYQSVADQLGRAMQWADDVQFIEHAGVRPSANILRSHPSQVCNSLGNQHLATYKNRYRDGRGEPQETELIEKMCEEIMILQNASDVPVV